MFFIYEMNTTSIKIANTLTLINYK